MLERLVYHEAKHFIHLSGRTSPLGTYVYKIIYTAYPDYEESKIETGQVVLVR